MSILQSRNLANRLGTVAMQAGIRDEDELLRAIRVAMLADHRIPLALPLIEEVRDGRADRAWLAGAHSMLRGVLR